MRELLNIIQEEPLVERVVELGDPEFVTGRQLVSKGIKVGFDKYFNTKGLDPLVIQEAPQSDSITVKWFEDSTLEIRPIRFRVKLSDTNPVGLLMDIIPILGRSQTGQTDLFKAQQVQQEVEPKLDKLTKELYRAKQLTFPGMETKQESDYSFLRTPPLWEQKLSEQDQNDLPLIKRNNLGPNSPHDINTKQFEEHPLIIISKNMSGEDWSDLHRKAYILEFIGKFTGANTRLINMTGNDSQYLKAVADKHGMIYTQHK